MRLLQLIFLLLVLQLIPACKSSSAFSSKSAETSGSPDNKVPEINEVIYHINSNSTKVYLEIKNENLLYKYSDSSASPYAHLKVAYALYDKENTKQTIDSASYFIFDKAADEILKARSLYTQFALKTQIGREYSLDLLLIDINKRTQYSKTININRKDPYGKQNFLPTQRTKVSFKKSFCAADTLEFLINDTICSSVFLDCFTKEIPLAPPPFSTRTAPETNPQPDSSSTLAVNRGTFTLILPKSGFYHLRTSSKNTSGFTVFAFSKAYPGLENSEEMINCTRYIMSKEEFRECKETENKKKAIDKFWLEVGGSNERAKELLKRYYNRVKEANVHYGAFAEGWKSDRGMIYIVFGEPNTILEKKEEEEWIYGSPVNQSTTTFIFKKIQSPYSEGVLVLDRSAFYKGSWSNAVDMWRQGVYYEGRQ